MFMPKAPKKGPQRHLKASDARGIALLVTQATRGVTGISEGVHQAVWQTLGAPDRKTSNKTSTQTANKTSGVAGARAVQTTGARTTGITGLVYQSIRGITNWVEKGLDATLAKLQPLFDAVDLDHTESPERAAVLAALNGVLGDHLAASSNPLATPMRCRINGDAMDFSALPSHFKPSGKVLLAIHGLCMNDLQWNAVHHGQAGAGASVPSPNGADGSQLVNHVESVAEKLGYTAVYLRYNSGLHTSQNGHELARQLAQLTLAWPVPIEEISVVVHSMGGLVIRSAVYSATQSGLAWPGLLQKIVFLGTPHHGAPLERAGNWVDVILGSTPYSRPFAKLGQLRSAGITDLRYGHVCDADWQGHDRFRKKPDGRVPLALPSAIACFTMAATTANKRSLLADRLVGDGLVPLHSALGQHEDPARCLNFPKESQLILYRTGHLQLLSSPQVTRQLLLWLAT